MSDQHQEPDTSAGGDVLVASVEETNRMRKELGLKPLNTGTEKAREGSSKNPKLVQPQQTLNQHDDDDDNNHSTSANGTSTEQQRGRYSSLGEALSERTGSMSTADWIKRVGEKKKTKKASAQGKKQDKKKTPKNPISEQDDAEGVDLSGFKVKHTADQFQEGNDTVLTLADKGVLDENQKGLAEDSDELENVDFAEQEKWKKRRERKEQSRKPVYSGYDDEEFSAEYGGQGQRKFKNVLSHYDDEEETEAGPASVFTSDGRLVPANSYEAKKDAEEAKKRLQSASRKRQVDLNMNLQVSSEFQTKEEAEQELERFRLSKKHRGDRKKKKSKKLRKSHDIDDSDEEEPAHRQESSSQSLVAELQATADTHDDSKHRGRRSQKESHGQRRQREDAEAAYESRKRFEQAVESAQEQLTGNENAKGDSGVVASNSSTGTGESFSQANTFFSNKDSRKSKVSKFTGHRVYNWNGKSSGIAADADEDILEDDADLWESISRSAQMNASRNKPSQEETNEQDEDDTGAAQAASFIKQLQTQRKQADNEKHSGFEEEGLVFTTTTEFSRRLHSQVQSLNEEEQQKKLSEVEKSRQQQEEEEEIELQSRDVNMEAENEGSQENQRQSRDILGFEDVASTGGAASALQLLRQTGELSSSSSKEYAGRANDPRPTWEGGGDDPAPNIKLERRDEFGRKLTTKEAYRQLCYRFHGTQKGKRKRDKQLREIIEAADRNPSAAAATGKGPERTSKALDVVHNAKAKSGRAFVSLGKGAS
eukprot:gb/GECG01005321.1/.p1 GENE.gb/GECG01005321.1/~~gb/GECG01005321.1/.p1  ORF type:complete len:766 (+),score=195.96 gb/GECG01005321.1/:1-2298(+)